MSEKDHRERFFSTVRELHRAAGSPSVQVISRKCGVSQATIRGWIAEDTDKQKVPRTDADLEKVVTFLLHRTGEIPSGRGLDAHQRAKWAKLRWHAAQARRVVGRRAESVTVAKRPNAPGPGIPLAEVTDPFELDVHRPILPGLAEESRPLPPYVRRKHDDQLAEVVEAAAAGRSGMAVLVAGSSAGKTRALWEALKPLRDAGGWRLWHPMDPTRRDTTDALMQVQSHTVVWLNETQKYLIGEIGAEGERTAAQVARLLADLSRRPVLILGTLWPAHHNSLCRDPASQVRKLLDTKVIRVPDAFTGADLEAVQRAAISELRLKMAFERAEDGQIAQYLAGGPELVQRYQFSSSPAARAIIDVAMDARRMGHRNAIPLDLFTHAAHAYMSGTDWDNLDEDWLEQALAETGRSCKGARGPVTRRRPRPYQRPPGRRSRTNGHNDPYADDDPSYQLADYLDQYGRVLKDKEIPPFGFWDAVRLHAHPQNLDRLGDAAWNRGLRRHASRIWKRATLHGSAQAALALVENVYPLNPADHRVIVWAAEHAALGNPGHTGRLLMALQKAGANSAVQTLLSRGPAEQAVLDDPRNVAELLQALEKLGADSHIRILLSRSPAAHVELDNATGLASLLETLLSVGAAAEVALLLSRGPAEHVSLYPAIAVALLESTLRDVGADYHFSALTERRASGISLDDGSAIAGIINDWRWMGADSHIATLLSRRPEMHAAINDPCAVADLLASLQKAGAYTHVAALLARDPARHAELGNPFAVTLLLETLQELGAREHIATLLSRKPAEHSDIHDLYGVYELLGALRAIRADSQYVVLAERTCKHARLVDPLMVARLIEEFQEANALSHLAALLSRDVAGTVELGSADGLAHLLRGLRDAGAHTHITTLLSRNPAENVHLDDSYRAAELIQALQEVRGSDQAAILAERLPAAGMFDTFVRIDSHKERFRFGREPEGSASYRWGWDDLA